MFDSCEPGGLNTREIMPKVALMGLLLFSVFRQEQKNEGGICIPDEAEKSYWCGGCSKELQNNDIKDGKCVRCAKVPTEVESCLKRYWKCACAKADKELTRPEKPKCNKCGTEFAMQISRARTCWRCPGCSKKHDSAGDCNEETCKKRKLSKSCEKSGEEPHIAKFTGIAALYLDDVGIDKDPHVIFAHDFEDASKVDDLRKKWDSVFHDKTLLITKEAKDVYGGNKAIEMTFKKKEDAVGNGLMKYLKKKYDVLFLRFYSKFEKGFDVTGAGSFHNGGSISGGYYKDGRSSAGERADGRNKLLVSYEATVWSKAPSPGHLTAYVYHPEQRHQWGDLLFPTGIVTPNTSKPGDYGKSFVSRPDIVPELDRWHCFEFMVQANTPGQRDGSIALWLDGRLIAEFPNMRFRDVETLQIDCFTIGGYINPNKVRDNKIWFDDVVAATRYIGPKRIPSGK
jgi:hypothetical protein